MDSNFFSSLASYLPLLNYSQNQKQYTQPQANVANAMADHSNPLYQQMYGQNLEQGNQALAQTISQLSGQNRQLSAMGRTPLFDPERGGETLFRGLTQGAQNSANTANTQTMSGLNQQFNNYSALGKQQQQGGMTQAMGQSSLGGLLKAVFGL